MVSAPNQSLQMLEIRSHEMDEKNRVKPKREMTIRYVLLGLVVALVIWYLLARFMP